MAFLSLMGYGDEIMVTALAAEAQNADPRPVLVCDRSRRPRYHDIFIGNPRIVDPSRAPKHYQYLINGPGRRPYIAGKTDARWFYTSWRVPRPGELYLTRRHLAIGEAAPFRDGGIVALIEPHVKANASPNKRYPFEQWAEAVAMLSDVMQFAQCDYGLPILPGATPVRTSTFREACGAITGADLFIGSEGGMHHAAAALGTPAVVWFGGMVSPHNTGYEMHENIFPDDGESPCGSRVPCGHCARIARAFTAEDMARAIQAAALRGTGVDA